MAGIGGLIDADLAEFIEGDAGQYVGTAGADGNPSAGRAWGVTVHADCRIRALVGADDATVANLRDAARVALCLTDVATFRSVQLKGRVLRVAPPDADDRRMGERYLRRFADAVAALGVLTPVEQVRPDALVAVTIEVDAVFDQTPGPQAGARLGGGTR